MVRNCELNNKFLTRAWWEFYKEMFTALDDLPIHTKYSIHGMPSACGLYTHHNFLTTFRYSCKNKYFGWKCDKLTKLSSKNIILKVLPFVVNVRLARIVVKLVLSCCRCDAKLELWDTPSWCINPEFTINGKNIFHCEINKCLWWARGECKWEDCLGIVASHEGQQTILLLIPNKLIRFKNLQNFVKEKIQEEKKFFVDLCRDSWSSSGELIEFCSNIIEKVIQSHEFHFLHSNGFTQFPLISPANLVHISLLRDMRLLRGYHGQNQESLLMRLVPQFLGHLYKRIRKQLAPPAEIFPAQFQLRFHSFFPEFSPTTTHKITWASLYFQFSPIISILC